MIVRILSEGQYEVPDKRAKKLSKLDETLMAAVDGKNEESFRKALNAILTEVRAAGTPLAADYLGPSDMALPPEGASREEVRRMLHGEGAVPD